MAKMTFRMTVDTSEWTELAAGSAYSAIGLVTVAGSVLLFIGDTAPEMDETDTIEISSPDTREIAVDLPSSMTAYIRSERNESSVQGYKVPV